MSDTRSILPHGSELKNLPRDAPVTPWPRCWCGKRVAINKVTGEPRKACRSYHLPSVQRRVQKDQRRRKNDHHRRGQRGNYRDCYEARALMGCL